ncbi:hypothetical protein AB1Y20_006090 [Prymnesium parvum]|uniref:Rubisco accumulation factor 1 C-terminal domain-containing protein n=1 Tax=Prymnesium parvum TaxID=97485 RepID=A0AB34J3R0_PRYPA
MISQLLLATHALLAGASFSAARLHCGLRPTPPRGAVCAVSSPQSETAGLGEFANGRPDGVHGTGFRFMPMSSLSQASSPALLCIAGAYPGLTSEQLLSPQPLPFAPQGKWNYHRLTGSAVPTGFVALPGSDLLDEHPNTVAVVATSESLGVELADGQVHEVIALIDRSDAATTDPSEFKDNEFYAFADTEGTVHIRWFQAVPSGWRVLGRLLYTQLPYVKKPGSSGTFAELSDDFEF